MDFFSAVSRSVSDGVTNVQRSAKLALARTIFARELKGLTLAQTLGAGESGRPVFAEFSASTAIREGLKQSHWVYACVRALMKAASSVPWVTQRRNGDGDWETVDHPFSKLMAKPNPFMSGQDLIERLTAHLFLVGNGIWSLNVLGNTIVELWPLNPDEVKPVPDNIDFISAYKWEKPGAYRPKFLPPNEVVHFQFCDPSTPYWGLSPLQAAWKMVKTEVDIVTWWNTSLHNRLVPDGMIKFKAPMNEKQYGDALAFLKEQRLGQDYARMPLIAGGDADYVRMNMNPVEMDMLESRKMTREDICSVFGVPPPIVGIYEQSTFNNIQTARKIFWLDTVIPYLTDLESTLNISLSPDDDTRITYDTTNVEALQEDFDQKVDTARKLWAMGVPLNAIDQRLELGIGDVPGGDIGLVPAMLIPLTEATAPTPAPAPSPTLPAAGKQPALPAPAGKGLPGAKELPTDAPAAKELSPAEQALEAMKSAVGESFVRVEAVLLTGKARDARTEARRKAFWRAFDRERRGFERSLSVRTGALFAAQGREVVGTFKSGGDLEHAIEMHRERWGREFIASWKNSIAHFGGAAAQHLGATVGKSYPIGLDGDVGGGGDEESDAEVLTVDPAALSILLYGERSESSSRTGERSAVGDAVGDIEWVFDSWPSEVQDYVATVTGQHITAINATTLANVRAIIATGFEEGKSTVQVAGELEASFAGFSKSRSMMIARTEVVGASNYGNRQAALQSGVVTGREWLSSRDDRVRETHQKLEGHKIANMVDPYPNGCMFPGDPNGPAAEVCNCRCVENFET